MSRQQSCFEPFICEGHLRFRYRGKNKTLEGQYIRIFLATFLLYIREDLVIAYQQNAAEMIHHIAFYNTTGEHIDPHSLTISYHYFEQHTLKKINSAIVAATGSTNSLLVHRKGLIYHDEWQVGYKGSTTIDEMKYKLALEMVKHSEIGTAPRRPEDKQKTLQAVVAAMMTEEDVQSEYNDCYYLPCLRALLQSAIEQLTCPPICLTWRTGNDLARLNEHTHMVIFASPQYRQRIDAAINADKLEARSELQNVRDVNRPPIQHYQPQDESDLRQPPATLVLEDITYHKAARSLLGIFYVYEAVGAESRFQPRQTALNPPPSEQYAELAPQLPVIFSKNDRYYTHTIDTRKISKVMPHELYPSIIKGVSANDVAQALGLPEDPVCPHYGYEWFHLERPNIDNVLYKQSQISWHDIVLVTWRCRTTLHRVETLVQKILQSYPQKQSMHSAMKDAKITIKPSYTSIGTKDGKAIFLPQRLEYSVTFNISHPVTTQKVLRYVFDPLSNRQPAYIEARLDEAILPDILRRWSVESIRQRIQKNM